MPIPTPNKGEDQQDFVSRCMGDDVMNKEYSDQKQRAAICYSSWRKKHGTTARPGAKMQMTQWYTMKLVANDAADIMIYDEIGSMNDSPDGGGKGSASDFAAKLKGLGNVKTINLRINSPGGSAIDGLAMYNVLKSHPAKVVARVDGIAASAATLPLMAADQIIMPENTFMLIHNPHGVVDGDAAEMRRTAENFETMQASFAKIYADRAGRTVADVQSTMDEGALMSAREAVMTGFADTLEGAIEVRATFDLTKLPEVARVVVGATMIDPKKAPKTEATMEKTNEQLVTEAEEAKAKLQAAEDAAKAKEVEEAAAKEIREVCALARCPVSETEKFVAAKMSIADVRKKLFDMRAEEDERLRTHGQRPNVLDDDKKKKNAEMWEKVTTQANARVGMLGRK